MCGERGSREAVCESIRNVVRSRALDQGHDVILHEVSYKVTSDVNVPCKFTIDGVVRDLDASR
eukprot:2034819-Rhodomonas_salina.1